MDEKRRTQTLVVLFVGVLMGALDIAIIGPALPAIQAEFALSPRQLPWIFSIYVLMQMISTPLMAKLSDFYGRRAIYLLDVAMFAVGSLVVAASHGSGAWLLLLAGRAIQGFGAGGIFPVASAVIGDTFPPEKRGGALGMIGAVFGLAFLIGPVIGGLLLGFGWHWLFLDQPAAGAGGHRAGLAPAAAPAGGGVRPVRHGRDDRAGRRARRLHLRAQRVRSRGRGDQPRQPRRVAAACWRPWSRGWRWCGSSGVPRTLCSPSACSATASSAVAFTLTAGAGLGEASVVFLPLLAVLSLGVTPSTGSYLLLPLVVAMAVGSPLTGRLLDRLGSRTVILAGLVIMAVGMVGISQAAASLALFIVFSALIGLGLSALLGAPIRYITLNETTAEDRSAAQGMVTTFTSVGQLVSAALVGAVAASFGETAHGYDLSFLGIGVVAVTLLAVGLLLKSRAVERATRTS